MGKNQFPKCGYRLAATAAMFAAAASFGIAHATTLWVPATFPTIQSAVDAAVAGDTIRIAPGKYPEQLSIDKSIKLIGAGAGRTLIQAPGILAPGQFGGSSIVEIHSGASVAMSSLTIAGPGKGTCDSGALENGILVAATSHLDLSFAVVKHIHDTPFFECFRSGNAIIAFDASADIRNTYVSDYQAAGIVIVGGTARITHNIVKGPGALTTAATGGIELVAGARGTITDNFVSGNAYGSPELGCGPDFFNQYQVAGITGDGAETVIARNLLFDNQVGIYVGDGAKVSHNVLWDNDYFGLALQDGTFLTESNLISGGSGGVAVIAAFVDTTATLKNVRIVRTSGARIQKFEQGGFRATVVRP